MHIHLKEVHACDTRAHICTRGARMRHTRTYMHERCTHATHTHRRCMHATYLVWQIFASLQRKRYMRNPARKYLPRAHVRAFLYVCNVRKCIFKSMTLWVCAHLHVCMYISTSTCDEACKCAKISLCVRACSWLSQRLWWMLHATVLCACLMYVCMYVCMYECTWRNPYEFLR